MEKVGVVDEDGVVEGGVRMPFVGLAYNELGFLSSCCEHLSFDLRHLAPVVAVVVDQVPKSLPRGLDAPRVGDQVVAGVGHADEISHRLLAEGYQAVDAAVVVHDTIHLVFPDKVVDEEGLQQRVVEVEPLVLPDRHDSVA